MTKRKQRSKRPTPRAESRYPPTRVLEGLETIQHLRENKQYYEAGKLINELDMRYPNRMEILWEMAELAQDLHEPAKLQYACRRLLKLQPKEPEALLWLASAYLQQRYVALALRTFREFLHLAPEHEEADDIRDLVKTLENASHWFSGDSTTEEYFKLAWNHEQVQVLLIEQEYFQAERLCTSALRQYPNHVPLLNNLSLIYRQQGKLAQAIEVTQQVLELEPDNIHALSNRIQYLFLSGRNEEARILGEPLRNSTRQAWEGWIKKVEGLILLEDYEGVLEVYRRYQQISPEQAMLPSNQAALAHFAAVASSYLGLEDEARDLWQTALQLMPGYNLAHANLEELDYPHNERNGAWAFPDNFWFLPSTLQAFRRVLAFPKAPADENTETLAREMRHIIRRHPEFKVVAHNVLTFGEPSIRSFVLAVADLTHDPALVEAVKDFALGQRGSDKMRLHALQIATGEQPVSDEAISMWLNGEWRPIQTTRIMITTEATQHGPKVLALLNEATVAQEKKDWKRAEDLYLQASALEPEAPDLQGNRAVMVRYQGREQEAEMLLQQVHQRFPNYVFARTNLALYYLSRGETEKAHDLLTPLFSAPKLHKLEFRALCGATIEVAIAENDPGLAQQWLHLWESYDPDDPRLDDYARWVEEAFAPPAPPAPQQPTRGPRRRSGL